MPYTVMPRAALRLYWMMRRAQLRGEVPVVEGASVGALPLFRNDKLWGEVRRSSLDDLVQSGLVISYLEWPSLREITLDWPFPGCRYGLDIHTGSFREIEEVANINGYTLRRPV